VQGGKASALLEQLVVHPEVPRPLDQVDIRTVVVFPDFERRGISPPLATDVSSGSVVDDIEPNLIDLCEACPVTLAANKTFGPVEVVGKSWVESGITTHIFGLCR
jgi:hypothetical protein